MGKEVAKRLRGRVRVTICLDKESGRFFGLYATCHDVNKSAHYAFFL